MHPVSKVVVFDVNETLSNMSPIASRFADVAAPGHLAGQWFAALPGDGFATALTDSQAPFADPGSVGHSGACCPRWTSTATWKPPSTT